MPGPPTDDPHRAALHALKTSCTRALVEHTAPWSQWNAAVLLGTTQGVVSDLRAGKLERIPERNTGPSRRATSLLHSKA